MAQATDTVTATWVGTANVTAKFGYDMSCSQALTVISVDKRPGTTATTCYLYYWTQASPGSLIASTSFVSNTATFNVSISSGNFYMVCDSGGSTYTEEYWNASYPQTKTNVTYVSAWNWNTTQSLALASITTTTTAVKTVDWLAKASVKTVDALAIASVKTFNGLA